MGLRYEDWQAFYELTRFAAWLEQAQGMEVVRQSLKDIAIFPDHGGFDNRWKLALLQHSPKLDLYSSPELAFGPHPTDQERAALESLAEFLERQEHWSDLDFHRAHILMNNQVPVSRRLAEKFVARADPRDLRLLLTRREAARLFLAAGLKHLPIVSIAMTGKAGDDPEYNVFLGDALASSSLTDPQFHRLTDSVHRAIKGDGVRTSFNLDLFAAVEDEAIHNVSADSFDWKLLELQEAAIKKLSNAELGQLLSQIHARSAYATGIFIESLTHIIERSINSRLASMIAGKGRFSGQEITDFRWMLAQLPSRNGVRSDLLAQADSAMRLLELQESAIENLSSVELGQLLSQVNSRFSQPDSSVGGAAQVGALSTSTYATGIFTESLMHIIDRSINSRLASMIAGVGKFSRQEISDFRWMLTQLSWRNKVRKDLLAEFNNTLRKPFNRVLYAWTAPSGRTTLRRSAEVPKAPKVPTWPISCSVVNREP
ncbi:MAG: hypothetical protein C5B49_00720 [Bdellovibrio sp.]|nr:MAG: hypothetical protein C5B49_00720 [Bdellovibrio sp.]